MRDHPRHVEVIMGGDWDCDLTRQHSRSKWEYAFKLILNDPMTYTFSRGYDEDQVLLAR